MRTLLRGICAHVWNCFVCWLLLPLPLFVCFCSVCPFQHPHREYEIFSYVCSGALKHRDSMGNVESLGRGYVQFTSAGTGIAHSEFNDSQKDLVHFLQMWVKPDTAGLKPSYTTRHWKDEDKLNQLRLILSKDGRQGSIQLHQNMDIYASILQPTPQGEAHVSFEVRPGREVYLHLIQDVTGFDSEANKAALTIRDAQGAKQIKLSGGDGALIQHSTAAHVTAGKGNNATTAPAQTFTITGAGAAGSNAEFILFDIAKQ